MDITVTGTTYKVEPTGERREGNVYRVFYAFNTVEGDKTSSTNFTDKEVDAALAAMPPADLMVTDRESLWTLHNKLNRKLLRTRLEKP